MRKLGRFSFIRGFTLTEMAIVLSIFSIVLGAIWVAASKARANQKANMVATEITTILNGTRAMFANKTDFSSSGLSAGTEMTGMLISNGIIPPDMVVNGITVNPWGTTQALETSGNGISVGTKGMSWGIPCNALEANNVLEITIWGVPPAACPALMSRFIGPAAGDDVICVYSDATLAFTSPSTTPISAVASCSGNVTFYFKK